MEERRLLLAVVLSFLVLLGYRVLFPPPTPAPRPAHGGTPATATTENRPSPPEARPAVEPTPTVTAVTRAVRTIGESSERRIEAESQDLRVAFTNRGGRLLSWGLKRFRDTRGHPEEMVQMLPDGARPLDLVTGDEALDRRLREALFRGPAERVDVGSAEASIRFEYADDEIEAEKSLRIHPTGYLTEISVSVRHRGEEVDKRLLWGPGVGNPREEEREVFGFQETQAVLMVGREVRRVQAKNIGAAGEPREVRWAGLEAMYFTALWIPPEGLARVELSTGQLPPAPGKDADRKEPIAAIHLGTGTGPVQLYVGPKDYHQLVGLGRGLSRVVPVGDWIGPVVVPLMSLLRWVHGRVGNYGWSIVALTVLINLAMAPLRHYSIANGMKMAKLAPEMKVIQERYRKVPALDPRRQDMQKEVAALYARHGMSMGTQMMVGCLPLLLTMPFLLAFYRVLMVSIDLRGAAFLWMPDLSHKDPLYVTPVLMGVSMLVMQRMTPTTMDPAQQRIMLIMPLVLVVMFFAAPAGLNLYWLASNLCSIVQQTLTMKLVGARNGAAKKERKRK